MKLAVIFIGTSKYLEFLPGYYSQAEKYLFPGTEKQYFVFTDGELGGDLPENITVVPQEHLPFPYITLYRFDIINRSLHLMEDCTHLLFLDADTQVVDNVYPDDVFIKGHPFTGVHHPCHALGLQPHDKYPGAFETDTNSLAHVTPADDTSIYWQGCVWGATMEAAVELVKELDRRTKVDEANGIIAKWHDESQINKYFIERKRLVHTLDPCYAHPEVFDSMMPDEPKIVHLAKENSEYQV